MEYLGDPKIESLSPAARSCWVTLLCFASESNGVIKHLSEENLMRRSGLDPTHEEWDSNAGVLRKFEQLNMIVTDSNGNITVCNWQKRQEINLTNAERQARFRDRHSNAKVTQVTQNNKKVTLDKNRIDKNRITERERAISSPPPKEISLSFFSEESERQIIISGLVENGMPENIARAEIGKFVNYWTELNQTGKKQRWEH